MDVAGGGTCVDRMDWSYGPERDICVSLTKRAAYPMAIGSGRMSALPELLTSIAESDSVVVVTDDTVSALYLDRTLGLVRSAGLVGESIVVPQGELSKTWSSAERLLTSLTGLGAKRRSLLVALGGGVICDLVGFIASVFMRGIPYVNVPTTLMAQLDAAVGGKTGIDFQGSKNLVGSFHHPSAVLVDTDLLVSLPRREVRSGLAEAVKVGILFPPLFEQLESTAELSEGNPLALEPVVREAIAGKLQLLREDPFERSLRRFLNLGHTVGHALEATTGFVHYRHGEAVAIGIAVATHVSHARGMCSTDARERIVDCLSRCGLSVTLPLAHADGTWRELDVIRRIRNGRLNEVLPVDIGLCEIVDEVDTQEYTHAVGALEARACGKGR